MTWHQRFFALLLVFLPTQLGLHFWPNWSMVLGRKIDYLSPTVYLTDVLIIALLVSWFIESFSRIKNYELRIKNIILLFLFVGLNIYYSQNHLVAIYKWIKVFEFGLLGFYIIRTKPHLSLITYLLSLGVLYSSLIAIGQFILQHSIGGPFWFLGERTFSIDTPGIARIALGGREMLRAYATFPHPNVLGGFLAVTLPLVANKLTIQQYNKTTRIFYLIIFAIGMIGLILTFSRSAWIVGGLAILMAIIRNKKSLVFVFLAESVVVRQELNTAALSLWQQSPLIGVGLGNFLVQLPQVLASRQIYFLQPVHNIYLLVLAETGIVGLLTFVWLIVKVWKNYELRIKNYEQKNVRFVIRNSLFVILVLGLVDHYPLTIQQGQLLFTLVLALGLIQ